MPSRSLWTALAAAVCLTSAAVAASAPGARGVSVRDMDLAADPRADFARYANGGWLDRTRLPADAGSHSSATEADERIRARLARIMSQLERGRATRQGSDTSKLVRIYRQGLDLRTRNRQGLAPIAPTLAAIDRIGSLASLHRFLEASTYQGVSGLFQLDARIDLVRGGRWVAHLDGPLLGLPGRDFYLARDSGGRAIQRAYVANNGELLRLTGVSRKSAASLARAVFRLERRFARLTLDPRAVQRDIRRAYNQMTVAELGESYPLLRWRHYLDRAGLRGTDRMIVTEPVYLRSLARVVRSTPLATAKAFLRLQLLRTLGTALDGRLDRALFDMTRVLTGESKRPPLREQSLDFASVLLPDVLARAYARRHFPPASKRKIVEIAATVKEAFRARLARNPWLSPRTKRKALAKLARLEIEVGYPPRWRNYRRVRIGSSYAASFLSAINNELRSRLARAGRPATVGSGFDEVFAHSVDAGYNPSTNSMVFPAGILQPPFFDPAADPASNFGAIGYVIGHEITHAFDLGGSQFDERGRLRNWWTASDRSRFLALNERLIDQYDAVEVLPGLRVDGALTVSENTADLGGLQAAYDALQIWLRRNGRPAPIDGLTQEQRFFVAAAQAFRAKSRPEYIATRLRTDTDTPPRCGRSSRCATRRPSTTSSASSPATPCSSSRACECSSGSGPGLPAVRAASPAREPAFVGSPLRDPIPGSALPVDGSVA